MRRTKRIDISLFSIIIALLIIVLLVSIFVLLKKFIFSKSNNSNNNVTQNKPISYTISYVECLDNDIKISNSPKFRETREFSGLSFSNLQLSEYDDISTLTGTITNISKEIQLSRCFSFYMLNPSGQVAYDLCVFLKEDLKPGQSTYFSAGITLDNVDIYDFYITDTTFEESV